MRKALAFLCLVPLSGCHKEDAAPAAPASAVEPAPVAPAVPKAEYHEDNFDLALRPLGAFTAGSPGSVEVQLAAKGGYHVNDKYPYKFRTAESDGVEFTSPVFSTEALKLEEKQAAVKVDLTPETKGEKSVRGTFAFSVCSAERCLVEKRELETKISVN